MIDGKLGERLRAWRHENGLTIKEFAKRSTLNASTITQIENSKHFHIRIDTALNIAHTMGADVNELAGFSPGVTLDNGESPMARYRKTKKV